MTVADMSNWRLVTGIWSGPEASLNQTRAMTKAWSSRADGLARLTLCTEYEVPEGLLFCKVRWYFPRKRQCGGL